MVSEAIARWQEAGDEPHEADSRGNLAEIYLLLCDFDKAEEQAHKARKIHERLGLEEAWKGYAALARIALARGNSAEAAAWEQQRDALHDELQRRAGAPALPQQTIQGIAQLAVACAQAGLKRERLGAPEQEALATIVTWPAPLDALAPLLRALAAGNATAVPTGLPKELSEALGQVMEAVREAKGGE